MSKQRQKKKAERTAANEKYPTTTPRTHQQYTALEEPH